MMAACLLATGAVPDSLGEENGMHRLRFHDLELTIDPESGRWLKLVGGKVASNWLSNEAGARTGLPFVSATALDQGNVIPVRYESPTAESWVGKSLRGEVSVTVEPNPLGLTARLRMPDRRGPRAGWCLDLNHLDLPSDTVDNQVMPVVIQTAEDLSWAYILWERGADDYLVMAMEGPFAGWYIRYSFAGHLMYGFQMLARADDVIADVARFPSGRLPSTTKLTVHLALSSSREEGIDHACTLLGLDRIRPSQTSVVAGGEITVSSPAGAVSEWRKPDGSVQPLLGDQPLVLAEPGVHTFVATAPNGRETAARVLALGEWRELAERAIAFHRQHFQTEPGAFARAIRGETLQPDGVTLEGVPFGDPEVRQSCRTGEFGGFAAWSQLKHMELFGRDEAMMQSVRRYFDWVTNKGREQDPRPNTLSQTPHEYTGREYGAYHLYQEHNYVQHEGWLIGQLTDAVSIGMSDLQPWLENLAAHFLAEHMDEQGVTWNENTPGARVDYSTVDAPAVHLLRAGKLLDSQGVPLGKALLDGVRKNVDAVLRRGLSFPTEGQPATEDGSIACAAWLLATAYNELENPDPAWLAFAGDLMRFHHKLEMSGDDIRMDGSSLRFWETMYESDEYGPSINASHGWTLWSASARWELFVATGDFDHLWQAWRHTMNVAHRLDARGAFPVCFTPDVIPAPPHPDSWDKDSRHEGRMTTSYQGMGYPSSLSMSGMHLFVTAPRMWYDTSGYDGESGRLVNLSHHKGRLQLHTPLPVKRIVLNLKPGERITLGPVHPGGEITLLTDQELEVEGLRDSRRENGRITGICETSTLIISRQ